MRNGPIHFQLSGVFSVVEQISSELRAAILAGRMRPEQEFTLRELAARFGVSYIPVREAVRILEADGLLLTSRGRSARVAPMSVGEVAALFRLRKRVEPDLAARAAIRHNAESLDRIECDLETCADSSITVEEHYQLHQDTHLALMRPAMTSWDWDLTQMLLRASSRYLRRAGMLAGDPQHTCAEHVDTHRELPLAFRVGDADRARAIMHDHLDSAERTAMLAMRASSAAPLEDCRTG